MASYLLAAGSVTSAQYVHARKDIWKSGAKPKLCRLTTEEWELAGISLFFSVDYEYSPRAQYWLRNAWVPIADGSRLHIPAKLLLSEDDSPDDLDVRIIKSFLNHSLLSPVGAVVIEERLWLSPKSDVWQRALPDAKWYTAHPEGWVETL